MKRLLLLCTLLTLLFSSFATTHDVTVSVPSKITVVKWPEFKVLLQDTLDIKYTTDTVSGKTSIFFRDLNQQYDDNFCTRIRIYSPDTVKIKAGYGCTLQEK